MFMFLKNIWHVLGYLLFAIHLAIIWSYIINMLDSNMIVELIIITVLVFGSISMFVAIVKERNW